MADWIMPMPICYHNCKHIKINIYLIDLLIELAKPRNASDYPNSVNCTKFQQDLAVSTCYYPNRDSPTKQPPAGRWSAQEARAHRPPIHSSMHVKYCAFAREVASIRYWLLPISRPCSSDNLKRPIIYWCNKRSDLFWIWWH